MIDPTMQIQIDGETVSLARLVGVYRRVGKLTMRVDILLEGPLFNNECETRQEVHLRHMLREVIGDILALPKPEGEK